MAKILVVDDEAHIVMILKDSLEFSGFQISTAFNGEEALEAVDKDRPDLIVLDIGMPKMDGWEVCRRLKSNDATRGIPIIILTAYAQMSDQKKGAALGAERFVTKPCDLTYLIEEINALLAQKAPPSAPKN